jgi:hypothetical protein
MTNPQTWTLLGAGIALVGGMMAMMFHMNFHYIRRQFESFEARMGARFDKVDNGLERVEDRLDGVEGRLHGVETELTRMDRDIQGIAEKAVRDEAT